MICLISGTGICWRVTPGVLDNNVIKIISSHTRCWGRWLAWGNMIQGQCLGYLQLLTHNDTHDLESVSYIPHTQTLLSGNDRKRLLTVTNCFRCCGELKCHKTVCLTHNAYSFECPSHTQSLCAIIVRHTWPGAIWSTSLQIEGGPHFTVLIWINMICLIYGTGICSVYHMIQTILEYTYIRPVHALLDGSHQWINTWFAHQ